MASDDATLLATPPSRFRHSAIEARLPPGSRLARDAFGDGGERWGSSTSSISSASGLRDDDVYDYDGSGGGSGGSSGSSGGGSKCQEGTTLLVFGGYDGSRTVWGGRELLLLRVSKDGRRVRWGKCDAEGDAPPPCFHHTMTRLRRDLPTPRAVVGAVQVKSSRPITRKRLVTTLGSYIK